MKTIRVEYKEEYAIITLDRGRANPINLTMMEELQSTIEELKVNDQVFGVILNGKEGFFTGGLDVIEMFQLDRDKLRHFWSSFIHLFNTLVQFPKPLIASITGHSPAGGCVLACCCDYRVMAEGDRYRIGLNEIAVGIAPRDSIFYLYEFWIGKRLAYQYLLEGRLMPVKEALEIGLVDELAPDAAVLARAEAKMQQYLMLIPSAFRETKMALRKELIEKMTANWEEDLDKLQEQLWSPESRFVMGNVVQHLTKRG